MSLELQYDLQGGGSQTVDIDQPRLIVGSLPSNQIILGGKGVEPIHALIEQTDSGKWLITDLGTEAGVIINGKKVKVEQVLQIGDKIQIGSVNLLLREKKAPLPPPLIVTNDESGKNEKKVKSTQKVISSISPKKFRRRQREDLLFSPRFAKPSGDVLEVVAYWDETILDVEHFHPRRQGYERVTIGSPPKAHFIAAGNDSFDSAVVADVSESSYVIRLLPGMTARLRRQSGSEEVSEGKHKMSNRDIAHVRYGPIKYFFIFMRPPSLQLPRSGPKDPLLLGLLAFFFSFYVVFMGVVLTSDISKDDRLEDDIWSVVHVPEREKPQKKPETVLAQVKKEPPPQPPKPMPKPVEPVKVKEEAKPKPPEPKPVEKPPEPKPEVKTNTTLTKATTQAPAQPSPPTPQPKGPSLNEALNMAKPANSEQKGAGSAKQNSGGGLSSLPGGIRKGNSSSSVKGVGDTNNNKASGVDLKSIGLGAGAIKSASGLGAISTNFKSSAGGAGGGSGSGAKTFGMGGVGTGSTLSLTGSGQLAENWGSGNNGVLGGNGKGIGQAFGGSRRPTEVNVRAGDPLVSGGLTSQEIMMVIRKNLNPIRHCYEQLLQRSPNANGKIKVRFQVGLDGRVDSVNIVESSIADGTMKNCVTQQIQRWTFPQPRGGSPVNVNYPFVFNPV